MPKLTVSVATYNEIASLLEAKGLRMGENVKELILEKGTELEQPVDYRLATIRKDAAIVASRAFNGSSGFVDFVDEIFQYILTGKLVSNIAHTSIPAEWK